MDVANFRRFEYHHAVSRALSLSALTSPFRPLAARDKEWKTARILCFLRPRTRAGLLVGWGERTDSHHGGGDTCSRQTCTCTIILRFGVCASDKIIYHKRRKEASPPTSVGGRGGGVSWTNSLRRRRRRRLPTPRPSPCNFGSGNTRARGWQSFKLRSSVCRRNVLRMGSSGGRAIFHYHASPSPPTRRRPRDHGFCAAVDGDATNRVGFPDSGDAANKKKGKKIKIYTRFHSGGFTVDLPTFYFPSRHSAVVRQTCNVFIFFFSQHRSQR